MCLPLHAAAAPALEEQSLGDWREDQVAIVIKQIAPWDAARAHGLSLEVGIELDAPLVPTLEALERLRQRSEGMGEVVYAVGGGAAADAGKFVAHALGLPLVCVPTALSCIAFFTPYVLLRAPTGMARYSAVSPSVVLFDPQLVATAPVLYRAGGVVDLLSVFTACLDWQDDHQHGKLPPEHGYVESIAQAARGVAEFGLAGAPSAHRGEVGGLRRLASSLALLAHLGAVVGHERFRVGSAHALAETAERQTAGLSWRGAPLPSPYTYAQRLAAGVLEVAERRGLDVERLKQALAAGDEGA